MMDGQVELFQDNTEYDAFVAKFKPKKTTDDCYTPPHIYDLVKNYACERYGKDPGSIVRPFYPGGDFEHFDYPEGCFVLDNPPFSILASIVDFYLLRGVDFFLFCPTLTALSGKNALSVTHLICAASVVYENGAVVNTSFVTNCEPGMVLRTAPDLTAAINRAQVDHKATVTLPKYVYPPSVVTAAMCQTYAKRGVNFCVRLGDCAKIRALDAQRERRKTIFGDGLLLSDRAAADRAAADRAAADQEDVIEWTLSDRELGVIKSLNATEKKEQERKRKS